MSEVPPPPERFKVVVLSLSNVLKIELDKARDDGIEVVGGNIVDFGIEFMKGSEPFSFIDKFVSRSFVRQQDGSYICCWDYVKDKNRDYFLKNTSFIFGELPSGIIDGIKVVLENEEESRELMESIWKHLFSLIKISINHIYLSRKPSIKKTDQGFNISYTQEYYSHVNIEDLSQKWGVDLMKAR